MDILYSHVNGTKFMDTVMQRHTGNEMSLFIFKMLGDGMFL